MMMINPLISKALPEFVSGSIFVRQMMPFKPGDIIEGHKHYFDHTSIFFNGRWRVKKWSPDDTLIKDVEVDGPCYLLIEAHCKHEFEYLDGDDDGIAWCVYSHRTPQGEVAIESNGWEHAYDAYPEKERNINVHSSR
jgi:hypothetical protein